MSHRRTVAAAALSLSLALAMSGGAGSTATADHLDDPARPSVPIDDPIPGHIEDAGLQVELQTVAEGHGLTAPNWGTFAPGHPNVLFVVDQDGPLWAINTRTGAKHRFLDTRDLLVPWVRVGRARSTSGASSARPSTRGTPATACCTR